MPAVRDPHGLHTEAIEREGDEVLDWFNHGRRLTTRWLTGWQNVPVTTPGSEPTLWRVAAVLCGVAAALLVWLAVTAPAEPAFFRVLVAVAALGLILVCGLVVAQVRGGRRVRDGRRIASLIAGAVAGAAVVAIVPAVGGFARPLGETTATVVQVAFALGGVGIAAIGIWGFVRRG